MRGTERNGPATERNGPATGGAPVDDPPRTDGEALEARLQPLLDAVGAETRAAYAGLGVAARRWIGGALAVSAGLFFLLPEPAWAAAPVALALGVLAVRWSAVHRAFRERFKRHVVGGLVAAFGPELGYRPGGAISEAEFEASSIFDVRPDRFRGEDLIEGRLGATRIRFSEVHAEQRIRRKDHTDWVTIFRGLFLVADFNKEFHGRTLVLPDRAERALGGLGRWLQSWSGKGELVTLEDPGFENAFVVYSSDQVEARYILSTSLMQRIMDYRAQVGGTVFLSFLASSLYVAIPVERNLLEPPGPVDVMRMSEDPRARAQVLERVGEYARDLDLALRVVEDLDLNVRIWSKE